MAAVGVDAWLEELRGLRKGAGEPRRYRARLRDIRRAPWELPVAFFLLRLMERGKERDHVSVLLYPETAEPGALPLVGVPVQVGAPVERIARGDIVVARGIAAAGHALVLDVDGETIPCSGPAWVPTVPRTLYRL